MDTFNRNNNDKTIVNKVEDSQLITSELELFKILAEAEEDVRTGRVSDVSETFSKARDKLC